MGSLSVKNVSEKFSRLGTFNVLYYQKVLGSDHMMTSHRGRLLVSKQYNSILYCIFWSNICLIGLGTHAATTEFTSHRNQSDSNSLMSFDAFFGSISLLQVTGFPLAL